MNTLELSPLISVVRLIVLLLTQSPLTDAERERLREKHIDQIFTIPPDQIGKCSSRRIVDRLKTDLSQGPEEKRAFDNCLQTQADLLFQDLVYYLDTGFVPEPHSAWRIGVILRRMKLFELEAYFLEAFSSHFKDEEGRLFQEIALRADSARELALKRLST